MEAHEDLLRWATGEGVQLHGIEPQRIPGRGIGLIATRGLKADEVLLEVPTSLLRTLDTVPKRIARKLPKKLTIHGLLAADLALNKSVKYDIWNAVTPTREDIWATLPLTWDTKLHEFLPRPAKDLLNKQIAKIKLDWSMVLEAFPSLAYDDYLYAWLLVNTRTFHYTTAKTEKFAPPDCMALQPVADLFNHSDEGCGVQFDTESFAITSMRPYAAGEEVHISYGSHSNDFLLVEYGFVMDHNRWDEVCIDDIILPQLSSEQKNKLEQRDFLGKYIIDSESVCYRTQVALRILCLPENKWKAFVDGVDDGEAEQKKIDRFLLSLLKKYEPTVKKILLQVEALKVGQDGHRAMLSTRWQQIQALLAATIKRLGS
ncbi:SET domain-containing protein [Thozetella sp. PMI_491]|nr:SET domain-containing protein [Thozetella sp. PMI_491]